MTRTSELSASCRNPAGHGRLKALPQPVLQRIEANEPRISRKQLMLIAAVLGSLPGKLHRVDGKLDWDTARMKFTNNAEANRYVKPEVRKGWSIA